MNFGNVFTTLCSSVAVVFSAIVYAQVDIPSHLELESTEAKIAYTNYIRKFDECTASIPLKIRPYGRIQECHFQQ